MIRLLTMLVTIGEGEYEYMKKKKTTIFVIAVVCTLSIIVVFIALKKQVPIITEYLDASYAIDVSDKKTMVGFSDYVFVGKVVSKNDTEYKAVPYTIYTIKVLDNLKGTLDMDKDIQIFKSGGISKDGSKYIIYEGDQLPEEGAYYIFFSCTQPDGSLVVSGANSNLFLAASDENLVNIFNKDIYREVVKSVENQVEYKRERYEFVD